MGGLAGLTAHRSLRREKLVVCGLSLSPLKFRSKARCTGWCGPRLRAARSGLRALPTLCVSTVKNWKRSVWSAVLQHRFQFGWRDDFHVVQGLVQAGPRWAVGLDDASPSNAGFAVPSGLLFCGANLAATRLPHPHLRCGFCLVKTRSLVGRAVLCPPDAESTGFFPAPTDYWLVAAPVRARKTRFKPESRVCTTHTGASRTCGTRPTLLSTPLV